MTRTRILLTVLLLATQAHAHSNVDADVGAEAKDVLHALVADAAAGAGAVPAQADAAANSAGNATATADAEAAGLALLRARNIGFDEGSFFRALTDSDVPVIRAFLDAGMSPLAPVAGFGPPIRAAIFAGSGCSPSERPTKAETKATVRLLLERGADPNLADGMGNTVLMAAAGKGCDRELMRILLSAGAKPGATNRTGVSAFEMGLILAHDGLEELIAAGYRLSPEKAKALELAYADKPAALALIRKATRR